MLYFMKFLCLYEAIALIKSKQIMRCIDSRINRPIVCRFYGRKLLENPIDMKTLLILWLLWSRLFFCMCLWKRCFTQHKLTAKSVRPKKRIDWYTDQNQEDMTPGLCLLHSWFTKYIAFITLLSMRLFK